MTIARNMDDWRRETQRSLGETLLFQALEAKCKAGDEPAGTAVLTLVDEVAHYAYHRAKVVLRHMPEFTLHDADHLFRIIHLMGRLIPSDIVPLLSVPELMLLILSALLHDIGMAPRESEVEAWFGFLDDTSVSPSDPSTADFAEFIRAQPDRLQEIKRLRLSADHTTAHRVQQYLVSDYIRTTHGQRCREILAADWEGKIRYRDRDLTPDLAQICYSHIVDPLSLLNMNAGLLCGPDVFACMPFVGVLLRLADILDFDAKRTPSVLFAHLSVRHPVSIAEWQKHRQVHSWIIKPNQIAFAAKCEHPAIEAAIRRFCDLIDRELIACSKVLQQLSDPMRIPFPSHYGIQLAAQVNRDQIGPVTNVSGAPIYVYRDSQFTLSKSQIIDLLMGSSLYGDSAVALRELIQNSIDACLVRAALETSWGNTYRPSIKVEFAAESGRQVLRVSDNGMGMDQYILDNHFSKVGSSFYKSQDFYRMRSEHSMKFAPISRFGIGVLSCFMVADTLNLHTRRLLGAHSSSQPLRVRIEGLEAIFWQLAGDREQPGTSIELTLHENNPWANVNDEDRLKAVTDAVPHPPVPIEIRSGTATINHDGVRFKATVEPDWACDDHVKRIDVSLHDDALGITGNAAIAILEEGGKPAGQKELFCREVSVGDDHRVKLASELCAKENEIERRSDSLHVTDNADIDTSSNSSDVVQSKAALAVHGISVPTNLVRPWWDRRSKTMLRYPFPINIKVDVTGTRDLDLNTARTDIIFNDKWLDFVDTLSGIICRGVKAQVSASYWKTLAKQWIERAPEERFKAIVASISN